MVKDLHLTDAIHQSCMCDLTYLTRLLTITPTACWVTLYTTPVRPWYDLCGMPFCTAPLPYMNTNNQ